VGNLDEDPGSCHTRRVEARSTTRRGARGAKKRKRESRAEKLHYSPRSVAIDYEEGQNLVTGCRQHPTRSSYRLSTYPKVSPKSKGSEG